MYYAMRASAPSLHRESTDSLIIISPSQCSYNNITLVVAVGVLLQYDCWFWQYSIQCIQTETTTATTIIIIIIIIYSHHRQ